MVRDPDAKRWILLVLVGNTAKGEENISFRSMAVASSVGDLKLTESDHAPCGILASVRTERSIEHHDESEMAHS